MTSSQLDGLQTELEMLKVRAKSWAAKLEDEFSAEKARAMMKARNEEGLKNAEERQAWVSAQVQPTQERLTRAQSWLNLYSGACKVIETRVTLLALQASGVRSNASLGGA